ncbi:hypothetical protein PGH07_05630 [Sulfurovum sp. zt1-1]|uniref:Uncharacterized protein n=1 Tax=Sulfurovum zhangzhouensis TaxID=3019067 RepID=A0ABT7QXU6_9BACT|nr:hypothetical protein [Sulfurovum zhangzhouensis]MDM5271647.1 hypothetical protein [Sulfurovum zhangzhouensis]
MKIVLRLLENKLTYIVIVYLSTMFMPWREIYKSQTLFTTFPMWWEYGNPLKNYASIGIHIGISIIIGLIIYIIIKQIINFMMNN